MREAWVIPGALEPREPLLRARSCAGTSSPPQALHEQRLYSRRTRAARRRVHVVVVPGRGGAGRRWRATLGEPARADLAAVVGVRGRCRGRRPATTAGSRAVAADGRSLAERVNSAVARVRRRPGRRAARRRPAAARMPVPRGRRGPPRPAGRPRHLGRRRPRRPHAAGRTHDPRFRPSWSPEMLLGANYIGRSFAMRRARYLAIGGVRAEAGAALHWDLLLRSRPRGRAGHPRRPGARQRRRRARPSRSRTACASSRSTSTAPAGRPRPRRPATSSACRGRRDDLAEGHRRHPDPAQPADAVDLPAVAGAHRLPRLRRGHRRQRRPHRRRTSSGTPTTTPASASTSCGGTQPFNYSPVNNAGASSGRSGEVLVFLNDDTEMLDPALDDGARRLGACSPRSASSACSSSAPTARSSTPA